MDKRYKKKIRGIKKLRYYQYPNSRQCSIIKQAIDGVPFEKIFATPIADGFVSLLFATAIASQGIDIATKNLKECKLIK